MQSNSSACSSEQEEQQSIVVIRMDTSEQTRTKSFQFFAASYPETTSCVTERVSLENKKKCGIKNSR